MDVGTWDASTDVAMVRACAVFFLVVLSGGSEWLLLVLAAACQSSARTTLVLLVLLLPLQFQPNPELTPPPPLPFLLLHSAVDAGLSARRREELLDGGR